MEDVFEECGEAQPEFAEMQSPIDKVGEDFQEVNAFHSKSAK